MWNSVSTRSFSRNGRIHIQMIEQQPAAFVYTLGREQAPCGVEAELLSAQPVAEDEVFVEISPLFALDEEEFRHSAKDMKSMVDPNFLLIAERDGVHWTSTLKFVRRRPSSAS